MGEKESKGRKRVKGGMKCMGEGERREMGKERERVGVERKRVN